VATRVAAARADALQHAPLHGAAADPDREPGAGVDPGRRAPGAREVPVLRAQARQAAPLLHGQLPGLPELRQRARLLAAAPRTWPFRPCPPGPPSSSPLRA